MQASSKMLYTKCFFSLRKNFLILRHVNKKIEILPTIEEEDEREVEKEELHVVTKKPLREINEENCSGDQEKCLTSIQQEVEETDNNCGLAEATEEVNDYFPIF